MFVCYFVDLDLGVVKGRQQNRGVWILKYGTEAPTVHYYVCFFCDKKEWLIKVPLRVPFMRLLLDLDLSRFYSVLRERYTLRLLLMYLGEDLNDFLLGGQINTSGEGLTWGDWGIGRNYSFDRCSVVSFIIQKLIVDLFMEKGGVCILSYRDILHADIFSLFMIWEEIHRCFIFLNLLMTTHTAWTN